MHLTVMLSSNYILLPSLNHPSQDRILHLYLSPPKISSSIHTQKEEMKLFSLPLLYFIRLDNPLN